jgi:hypothetical protein
MSLRSRICNLLSMIALVSVAFATNYQVGPSRTYTSLSQVVNLLNAGDSVFVDGNQTYTGGVTFTRPGEAGKPVVIKGVRINGNRPVLSGGTNTVAFTSPWPYTNGADHYVFESFEVTGGSSRGIFHQADDLTLRDVLVRNCPAQGVLGADGGSGSCLMEFCEVRNCGSGTQNHQIYMATDEVNHPGSVFRMQHCYIHDANGGNNVKSRAERNEIYYNWIEGGYYHELELIGCDGGDTGNVHLKREDSDVLGNVLRKKGTAAGNDSNFSITRIGGDGTGWTYGRYRFVNNTIIAGSSAVFRCFDTLESVEMHNNVFFRLNGAVNMMRTAEAAWTRGSPIIAGSNNWVLQGAQNVPSQWTGTITGANPGFSDLANADFRPSGESSPLYNAGNASPIGPAGYPFTQPLFPPAYLPPLFEAVTSAKARPVNGTIDIGAFEYSSASVSCGSPGRRLAGTDVRCMAGTSRGTVIVRFFMGSAGLATITVHDCAGKKVCTLLDRLQPAGGGKIVWESRDTRQRMAAGGIYVVTFEAAGAAVSKIVPLTN